MENLQPRQAHAFLRENPDALFVDVRSELEHLFVGHPAGALHVAWQEAPDWAVNARFVEEVKRLAGPGYAARPIVLICRSGNRSEEAARALEREGFARVYNVVDGFEGPLDADQHRNTLAGWRREGLPWQQG